MASGVQTQGRRQRAQYRVRPRELVLNRRLAIMAAVCAALLLLSPVAVGAFGLLHQAGLAPPLAHAVRAAAGMFLSVVAWGKWLVWAIAAAAVAAGDASLT